MTCPYAFIEKSTLIVMGVQDERLRIGILSQDFTICESFFYNKYIPCVVFKPAMPVNKLGMYGIPGCKVGCKIVEFTLLGCIIEGMRVDGMVVEEIGVEPIGVETI